MQVFICRSHSLTGKTKNTDKMWLTIQFVYIQLSECGGAGRRGGRSKVVIISVHLAENDEEPFMTQSHCHAKSLCATPGLLF